MESLQHDYIKDDEFDGLSVDLDVDLTGRVDPGEVVLVHAVLQYEVQ